MAKIAYCKIFPPIGIARLGNSKDEDGFFAAPDGLQSDSEEGAIRTYKDASGRVMRQAARFRIYAFDNKGTVVQEITSHQATITWRVELANKKASWFRFKGAAAALDQFEKGSVPDHGEIRNDKVGRLRKRKKGAEYDLNERQRLLNIVPKSPLVITGTNQKADRDHPDLYSFVGKFMDTKKVYLGELRTDDNGRLLVLGGLGHSAAVASDGSDATKSNWIRHYANNDNWHDDTSDGPVEATVVLPNGEEIRVEGRAWVVVAPPDFAPDVPNLVTLFDVMEEVALHGKATSRTSSPPLRDPAIVEFWKDIFPILDRAMGYRWVNDLGLRGHGVQKPGDFRAMLESLADPKSEVGKLSRAHILQMIRRPPALQPNAESAQEQASRYFMPPLSGDAGDATTGVPETWLTVTATQYRRLEAWASGNFITGKRLSRPDLDPASIITQTTLEACVGGPFYPGIEMTSIARSSQLYSEPFRLSADLKAGDVTKFMAVPWQADFYECNTNWWPAQRPDSVITARTVEELEREFDFERKQDQLESVMFTRLQWARGVGGLRPDIKDIQAALLRAPENRETLTSYARRIADLHASALSSLAQSLSPAPDTLAERVDTLERLQYRIQEQFDVYGGRFFHYLVPSPASFLQQPNLKATRPYESAVSYIGYVVSELEKYCQAVVKAVALKHASSAAAYEAMKSLVQSSVSDYEARIVEDFPDDSDYFFRLRLIEMFQAAVDINYTALSNRSGDNDMAVNWWRLGFVAKMRLQSSGSQSKQSAEFANVEIDRAKYDGLQYRDYYFLLCNIEKYPFMYDYCPTLVEKILQETRDGMKSGLFSDPDNAIIEAPFEYSSDTFSAKLAEIYEYFRKGALDTKPWEDSRTREDLIKRFVHLAPFNQNDGAWLRFVANSGTSDEIRGLLFQIWSDEFGNGNPALHHGNLYTTLLQSLNVYLPDVKSREYADYPGFRDTDFVSPVFQLAISQVADRYFPEILGMSLYLEWEVLSLVSGIKVYDYQGIDSQFWRMHVGIDNAVDGHGALARKAIEIYLGHILKSGGEQAMREEWERVWVGFVAFATAGYSYLGKDDDVADRRPQNVSQRIADMVRRKQRFGSLNHGFKRLGANKINDWFDDPDGFLDELAHSPWITPGDPTRSRLISYLTTFEGQMYKVFNTDDLALWHEWISWLGRTGDTPVAKRYQSKAESMLALLQELRSSAVATHGHTRYLLGGKTLHEWFRGDLKKLMKALSESGNGWVVPWDASTSPLVVDFARGDRAMGAALNQRFAKIGDQVGRIILVRWINAGCPIPGDTIPVAVGPKVLPERERKASLVEVFGQGSVH